MTIKELDPQIVWKNFYALTQIPRPSKHEELAVEYMYNWGKEHGLETIKDEIGNIIIRKPATPGCENMKGVILQGHIDMVPQKNNDTVHDFEKDPIQTWIDGEWVKAKGTTLGADNGLGVAMGMAVLESTDLKHGPIELLITVDEETTMAGAAYLDGKKIEGTGVERGVVFQQYALFPWLTVKKNVMFGLNLKKGMTEAEREATAMKYIKMVGLEKFVNAYPKELSGGMKQRVAIARAYAVNPSLLLMDEPFGALDAQTRTQLQTELLKTWEEEKKTCFFITHDVEEAILLASRVVVMSARPGRIKEVIDIDIPYPRNQETKMLPRFTELKNYIWQNVYKEYLEVQK